MGNRFSRDIKTTLVLAVTAAVLGLAVLATMIFTNQMAEPAQDEWPDNALLEGVAVCPGTIYSVKVDSTSVAVFASGVEAEQATEYIKAVSDDENAVFPLALYFSDRTVIIDYNDNDLSVTAIMTDEK